MEIINIGNSGQKQHSDYKYKPIPNYESLGSNRIKNGCHYTYIRDNMLHSYEDEPAIRHVPNGTNEWYENGKLHRGDGKPAIVKPNGDKYWFNKGNFLCATDVNCEPKILKKIALHTNNGIIIGYMEELTT